VSRPRQKCSTFSGNGLRKGFISSILNLLVEDLRKERKAVREVVESFGFLKRGF